MNAAAEDMLDVSRQRASGESILWLIGDDTEFAGMLMHVLESGNNCGNEFCLPRTESSSEDRILDCRVSPVVIGSGRLLVEFHDVTRRQKINRENALLVQHGAGRRMVRQLAHEIKNPLGGIRGAAQLLERQLDSEELREYTQVVISETDRLAALVDTLLGPGGPPRKAPVNIHELLEYVLRLIEAEAPKLLDIRREYDPGLPDISLDRDQIVQAVLNVVRNAVAALDGHGRLTIRTRATHHFTIGKIRHRVIATVEIEDDGPGIPPELQDTVFYPLVTSRPDGTGLGLPAAQELLSRHGGLIEFESRPGQTVFLLRIPIEQEASDD